MSYYLGGQSTSDVHPMSVMNLLDVPEFQRFMPRRLEDVILRANEYKYDTTISCPLEKLDRTFSPSLAFMESKRINFLSKIKTSEALAAYARNDWSAAEFDVQLEPPPLPPVQSFRADRSARFRRHGHEGLDPGSSLSGEEELQLSKEDMEAGEVGGEFVGGRASVTGDDALLIRTMQPALADIYSQKYRATLREKASGPRDSVPAPTAEGDKLEGFDKQLENILLLRRDLLCFEARIDYTPKTPSSDLSLSVPTSKEFPSSDRDMSQWSGASGRLEMSEPQEMAATDYVPYVIPVLFGKVFQIDPKYLENKLVTPVGMNPIRFKSEWHLLHFEREGVRIPGIHINQPRRDHLGDHLEGAMTRPRGLDSNLLIGLDGSDGRRYRSLSLEDFANLRSMPALNAMPCPLATALPPRAYGRTCVHMGPHTWNPSQMAPADLFAAKCMARYYIGASIVAFRNPQREAATHSHTPTHTQQAPRGRWLVRRCLASGWSEELPLPDEVGRNAFHDCQLERGDFLRWRRLYDHGLNLRRLRFIP